jgi:hypothetical protein
MAKYRMLKEEWSCRKENWLLNDLISEEIAFYFAILANPGLIFFVTPLQ